jgi:hypothetical protein
MMRAAVTSLTLLMRPLPKYLRMPWSVAGKVVR